MPSTTSELLHKSIQKLENVKGICGNEDGAKHKHIISPPPREPPSQASEMWEGKAGSWRLFRQVPRIQEACRNLHFRVHFEPWGPWPAVGQLWHPLYLRVASSRKSCVAWLLAAARPPQQATLPPQAFTAPLQASFSSQPVKLGH